MKNDRGEFDPAPFNRKEFNNYGTRYFRVIRLEIRDGSKEWRENHEAIERAAIKPIELSSTQSSSSHNEEASIPEKEEDDGSSFATALGEGDPDKEEVKEALQIPNIKQRLRIKDGHKTRIFEKKPIYFDTKEAHDEEDLYFFDPQDASMERHRIGKVFRLSIDFDGIMDSIDPETYKDGAIMEDSHVESYLEDLEDEELLGANLPFDSFAYAVRATRKKFSNGDIEKLQPRFAYRPLEVIRRTLEGTTQLAKAYFHVPMQRHFKARYPQLNKTRLTNPKKRGGERQQRISTTQAACRFSCMYQHSTVL